MQTVPRLLTQFIPERYELSLDISRIEREFRGTITIHGSLNEGHQHISFHAKDLQVESVLVDGKTAEYATSDNDELAITQQDLLPGNHVVVIGYQGKITDAMHGLYPCYYDHAGIRKEILATQFESHHAREVFPCIDEPEAKATFDVTLTTEEDITVLGNMPVMRQDVDGSRMVTTFQTSPRMSTYLLAFVAGEMHRKTATTKSGVEVNVWATPAQSPDSLDFALDIATKTIDFYDEYFDTPYPLPKSDHVALPDFGSGAMENWGLITYREIALLADENNTSISSRQYIATVIAHELAHQWFGNLVTMKWWNNLWLNESFATLMEYIAIDALHPEWNIWLDFSSSESVVALRRDALDGVQSVQVDVSHPDEISTLFDGAIVYAKGARLLRMIQTYIGDEAFQTGLKAYFAAHAYSNTDGEDLWKSLADASGKDVSSIMNTWISQPGYPVVHAISDNNSVTLTQNQFFVGPHVESSRLWPIPLNATTEKAPAMLTERSVTFSHSTDESLRLNSNDTAHFITHYDEQLFAHVISDLKAGALSVNDRLQVLNEATLLARGGILPSAQLITLIYTFKDETAEPVWGIIAMALVELRKFVQDDTEAEQKLRAFSASIARAQYERLGWNAIEGESDDDTKLRSTIISMTLYGEDSDAIAAATERFDIHTLGQLDPELRPIIISTAVRYGDDLIVDDLLRLYKESQSGELRQDISVGITSTRLPEKIAELLDAIRDPLVVRPQDAARWFVYMIRGRDSRSTAWQWIQDYWQWVVDTFGGDKSYDDYPRYSAGALSTSKELLEFKAFFEPMLDVTALTRAIEMGIKEIEGRVALIERDGPAVRGVLKDL